jgi:P27 family predicted phage terminase small subunit
MGRIRQKPPSALTFRRPSRIRQLDVTVPAERAIPPFPLPHIPETRTRAREAWAALWSSRVSAAIDLEADREALRSWLEALDELDMFLPLCHAEPVVGSRTGPIQNPLWRRVDRAREVVARFEERFGLTPQARFRLAITYHEAEQGAMKREREAASLPAVEDAPILDLGELEGR